MAISFTCAVARCIVALMSTAREIEEAICTLPSSERDKLLRRIPALFPELVGDAEWERLLRDEQARPELSRLLDETEEQLRRDPSSLPKAKASDFAE
jgi:hypothetical protein